MAHADAPRALQHGAQMHHRPPRSPARVPINATVLAKLCAKPQPFFLRISEQSLHTGGAGRTVVPLGPERAHKRTPRRNPPRPVMEASRGPRPRCTRAARARVGPAARNHRPLGVEDPTANTVSNDRHMLVDRSRGGNPLSAVSRAGASGHDGMGGWVARSRHAVQGGRACLAAWLLHDGRRGACHARANLVFFSYAAPRPSKSGFARPPEVLPGRERRGGGVRLGRRCLSDAVQLWLFDCGTTLYVSRHTQAHA